MIGKKYAKALLDRLVKCIEGRIGEEKWGFKKDRSSPL